MTGLIDAKEIISQTGKAIKLRLPIKGKLSAQLTDEVKIWITNLSLILRKTGDSFRMA